MNERIKALSTKAFDYAMKMQGDNPDITFSVEYDKKFAELIVKEVINTMLHYANVDEGARVAKQNFGVE